MGKNQLHRQATACRQCLQALEAVVEWREIASVWQLCEVLAAQRQRPIHVAAHALPPPMVGLWLASRSADYIFYAEEAPPLLQEHGVLHEVAHILLGLGAMVPHELGLGEEAPSLSPLTLSRMLSSLKRSCYEVEQECKAELLATLIEQRWRAARRNDLGPPPQSLARPDIRWLAEHYTLEP